MATTEEIPTLHCMHRDYSFQEVRIEKEEMSPLPLHLEERRTTQESRPRDERKTTQKLYDREDERLLLQECYRRCYQRSAAINDSKQKDDERVVREATTDEEHLQNRETKKGGSRDLDRADMGLDSQDYHPECAIASLPGDTNAGISQGLTKNGAETNNSNSEKEEEQNIPPSNIIIPEATTSLNIQEFILITGNSGTGKTALATSIREEVVIADGGFFVSGKFGHNTATSALQEQQPFAPFVAALAEWAEQVEQNRPSLKSEIRSRVQKDKGLTAAIGALLEEVPSLESLLGTTNHHINNCNNNNPAEHDNNNTLRGEVDAANPTTRKKEGHATIHFAVVFRQFLLKIVCRLGHPLVLLLDDLQWAQHQSSVDLLESLLMSSIEGLLIMGTCRPKEVSAQDPLSQMLRRMDQIKECAIVEVVLSKPLGLQAITFMVADATGLPTNECTSLAQTVLHETNGNALFTQQYIQCLLNWDLSGTSPSIPHYSGDSGDSSIHQSSDDRIVKWLVQQMQRLPNDAPYLLQVISCLGGAFELEVLQRTSQLPQQIIAEFLKIAVERNLLFYHSETQAGRFAHDKYQEAAYSLLVSTPSERALFHLRLGRNLLQRCDPEAQEFDQYLGTIVDLMLVGKEYLSNEEEKENLAFWCLYVGRKVALTSSFAGPWAIGYMEQGMQLLSSRHWRDQYNLSLALYNAAAELAYCQGNHSRVGELVSAIRRNARSFMDQVQACITSMYSLGAGGDPEHAIELGFSVLEKLGYPFPRKLSWLGIQKDLYKTRRKLHKFSEQEIMDLPVATDRKALIAMTVIQMMHPIFATIRPEYSSLTGSRLVQITLKMGSSPTCALGFALYSLSLVRMWRLEDAHRYGQLAMRLEEKCACREWKSKLWLTLGVGPAFLSNDLCSCYELMKKSHLSGLETGDMETGIRGLCILAVAQLFFGNQLTTTLETLKSCLSLSDDYSSILARIWMRPGVMVCKMLLDEEEALNLDLASQLCKEIKNQTILVYILVIYTFAATYMNKPELGMRLMEEIRLRKAVASQLMPMTQINQIFCEGILASGRKDLRVARRRLRKIKQLAIHNPKIFSNKVCLLEAEIKANARGRYSSCLELYDKAIHLSEKNSFLHEAALACEKAGRMLMRCKRQKEAVKYLSKSRVLYMQWGAGAKVKQIDHVMPIQFS